MKLFIDASLYPEKVKNKLEKRLQSFINVPNKKDFKFTKFKDRKNGKEINFDVITISDETNGTIINESTKIFSESNEVTNKLNFYRKK